jgi:hypothetical protein
MFRVRIYQAEGAQLLQELLPPQYRRAPYSLVFRDKLESMSAYDVGLYDDVALLELDDDASDFRVFRQHSLRPESYAPLQRDQVYRTLM